MAMFDSFCRNVVIEGHRTSIRLERPIWEALDEICRREDLTLGVLCRELRRGLDDEVKLASSLRSFAVTYFRLAEMGALLRIAAGIPWNEEPSAPA